MKNIKHYINTPEDEFHDFKQQWHEDKSELVRDILNFVNTSHHKDCYIIFGVSDNREIIGIEGDKNRKNTEMLSDLLHKLYLSTNSQIKTKVDTLTIEGKEIDILTIFNTDFVPVYLTKDYRPKGTKGLSSGLIYARNGSINTPRNESTSFDTLNSLFKKFNKLDVSIQEQYYKVLQDYTNWSYLENEEGSFFIYNLNPDFYMKFYRDSQNRHEVEAYSLSQFDFRISWFQLELRYRHLIIDERLLNFLDAGRALVPSPSLASLGVEIRGASYYYFYKDSLDFRLFEFLNKVFPISDDHVIKEFKDDIIIFENKEFKEQLHTDVLAAYPNKLLNELLSSNTEEVEKMYKHIKTRLPKFNAGETSHLLKQRKTMILLKSFLNKEI